MGIEKLPVGSFCEELLFGLGDVHHFFPVSYNATIMPCSRDNTQTRFILEPPEMYISKKEQEEVKKIFKK